MRRMAALATSLVLITTVFTGTAAAGELDGGSQVYSGLYSEQFFTQSDFDALAGVVGKRQTFSGTFHGVHENDGNWNKGWSNTREILRNAWVSKTTPFANVGIDASVSEIASGAYDSRIADWAGHVKQYLDLRGPGAANEIPNVIIAPLMEANGKWTLHGCGSPDWKVEDYIAAHRRFVNISNGVFGEAKDQVRWAWAPNGWTDPSCGKLADFWPGSSYVDIMAFSGFNFGTCVGTAWAPSAYWVFHDPVEALRAIDPTKPIIIAQTGAPAVPNCGGEPYGGQDAWVRDMFGYATADRNVVGFIYFNKDLRNLGETDYRVWFGNVIDDANDVVAGGTVSAVFKDGMQRSTTKYEWPLR
jgi:hypothetical protein